MPSIPEIWLGDLIRAMSVIPGTDDRWQEIAELLGLSEAAASVSAAGEDTAATVSTTPADTDGAWSREDTPPLRPQEPDQGGGTPAGNSVPELPVVAQVPVSPADWTLVGSLPEVTKRLLDRRPEVAPLLAPRSAAAILQALLARTADDGPIDVPRLTKKLAEGQPVSRLPRKPRRTLRFGVEVLIDMGEGMELFTRDQEELVLRIKSLVCDENFAIKFFADSPTRGAGYGPRRTWRTYHPSGMGSRILIVSDFGIGGLAFHLRRSRRAEWEKFMIQVRKNDCRAVGLIPYPPRRWPDWLARLIPLVVWDRGTTAGKAVTSMMGR